MQFIFVISGHDIAKPSKNRSLLKYAGFHVQALEKDLIPPSNGWIVEKAHELLSAAAARPKLAFPPGVTEDMVYEVVREIFLQLDDAQEQYIPKWAKLLRA